MSRSLFVACRCGDNGTGEWGPVGRLDRIEDGYRFVYTKGAQELQGFTPFPGMRELDAVYESETLFPQFANRLLSPSRPEYVSSLVWSGFDPDQPPDPIALLGVTEGLRTTDSLELFPCPEPDPLGRYVCKFFLHGVRWMAAAAIERINNLESNERLGIMLEVNNTYDPYAVAVRTMDTAGRFLIGYIPRYLARDVRDLCPNGKTDAVILSVDKLNTEAPMQQRVLCTLTAEWKSGFSPCSGEEFQPIVEAMSYTSE